MQAVPEDILPILARFHREVVVPDVKRIVDEAVGEGIGALEQRLNGHFDAIYQRFDRLETEYHMLVVGVKRIEERLDEIEQRLDRVALKSELLELKGRVEALERKIASLDADL